MGEGKVIVRVVSYAEAESVECRGEWVSGGEKKDGSA